MSAVGRMAACYALTGCVDPWPYVAGIGKSGEIGDYLEALQAYLDAIGDVWQCPSGVIYGRK